MLSCEIQLIIARKCGIFVDHTGKNKTGMQKKKKELTKNGLTATQQLMNFACYSQRKWTSIMRHHVVGKKQTSYFSCCVCIFCWYPLLYEGQWPRRCGTFYLFKHWTGSAKPALDFHPLLSGNEVLIVTHQGSIRLVEVWDFLPYMGWGLQGVSLQLPT